MRKSAFTGEQPKEHAAELSGGCVPEVPDLPGLSPKVARGLAD